MQVGGSNYALAEVSPGSFGIPLGIPYREEMAHHVKNRENGNT
jgi:hypothetical protein